MRIILSIAFLLNIAFLLTIVGCQGERLDIHCFDPNGTPYEKMEDILIEEGIEDLLEGAIDDVERAKRIVNWVHHRLGWKTSEQSRPGSTKAKAILEHNDSFGEQGGGVFCADYVYLTMQLGSALGMYVRMLEISGEVGETSQNSLGNWVDRYGANGGGRHHVLEFWNQDTQSWMVFDPSFNCYYVELLESEQHSTPVDALHIHRFIASVNTAWYKHYGPLVETGYNNSSMSYILEKLDWKAAHIEPIFMDEERQAVYAAVPDYAEDNHYTSRRGYLTLYASVWVNLTADFSYRGCLGRPSLAWVDNYVKPDDYTYVFIHYVTQIETHFNWIPTASNPICPMYTLDF